MAVVYLKDLLLKFLSYHYHAGYCWEDVGLSLHGGSPTTPTVLIFSHLPSLCFGPGFPRPDFTFASSKPIVTAAAKASQYEYGYLTLPAPTIPLPMTITMAPGALEFPFGGITKPGLLDVISAPGDYYSTGQLQYIFLACMISMWIGLFVNHFGNRRRASASEDKVTWWAAAYQRLLRELECRTKEQAERSERQKRRLSRTLLSQQLRLGTRSRVMRDRLTRRHRRSLSRAEDEATSFRKEIGEVQTKPTTSDPYESHGFIEHLRWQYDQAKLIIVKQSSTITRTEARVEFLQGRVDRFISCRLHTNSAAHRLEDDLKFRTKQTQLMEKLNGMSIECMLNTFTNESALILVQMVRLENRIEALTIDNQTLRQQASTLMLQPRAIETSVQSQALPNYEETIDLVSRMSIVDEELRQARADLDEKAHHRSESRLVESQRDEANERLSIENFNIQESNRQLKFELYETKIKLGRVTHCLQDALLNDRPTVMSNTQELSGDIIENTLTEPGTKATRPMRRSSTSGMECVQESKARPLIPLRRRSMSAAIPVSTPDTKSSITNRAEMLSLRQSGGTGVPGVNEYGGETCLMPSHGGVCHHRGKRRQHRKMREELEPQASVDDLAPLSSSKRP